jgi:hypothetical protein
MAKTGYTGVPTWDQIREEADTRAAAAVASGTGGVTQLGVYTVATLPAAVAGGIIYVSDGAAGSEILAFSDGTDWLRSDTGAAVAAAA